jgi:acyl phosphate:glycerol-3-phosphate acyltransferase
MVMWWSTHQILSFAPMAMLLAALGGYLLGSIPFGLVFTRLAGLGDIRKIGSGNIGATNVLRTGNKPLALATLLADGGKGAVAVLIAGAVAGPVPSMVAGCAAFLGHVYPVWLSFKGGKGVATYFGILIAFAWPIGLLAGATWIASAYAFRYSSLAALIAAFAAPLYFLLIGPSWLAPPTAFCSALIYWRHRSNISRLMNGTEPRIGATHAQPSTAER